MFLCRAKVSKYGDRLLETIETTIREYRGTDNRNSSSSNDSMDSMKRRREDKSKVTKEGGGVWFISDWSWAYFPHWH